MNKKHIVSIVVLVIFVAVTLVVVSEGDEPDAPSIPIEDMPGSTMPDVGDETQSGEVAPAVTQISASDEPPLSLKGVSMITHTDESGYRITFPTSWVVADDIPLDDGRVSFFGVSPVVPPGYYNPLIMIDVALGDTEELQPDTSMGESWVEINGTRGVLSTGSTGASGYTFVENGLRYTIVTNDTFLAREGLNKEELQWVLSTFTLQ